jgi:hypothetical protein
LSPSQLASHFLAIEHKTNELLILLGLRNGKESFEPIKETLRNLGDSIASVLIEQGTNNAVLQNILRVIPAEGRVVGSIEANDSAIGVTGGGSLNLIRMMLIMLEDGASRAREEAYAAVTPGRGGARRKGRTPSSAFALDLIALYCEIRRRYPGSGPVPGYSPGGPLPRFISAVFAAVREHNPDLKPIRDASVGSLFYQVRRSRGGEDRNSDV